MKQEAEAQWTAFAAARCIARGTAAEVALASKRAIGGDEQPVLVFDDAGRIVDIDYRGTDAEVVARLARPNETDDEPAPGGESSPYRVSLTRRGRGRPRLGVVAREVTLLPRHWDWLATQPGGASAAVRRLVDEARQASGSKDRVRQAKESAYRFMSAMAGDAPGFEEATRALFAGNEARLIDMTAEWPSDVRDHARAMARRAFG
jgi:hypothetical protein